MIFIDDNSVKVSGIILPGLIKSLEIVDTALIEEQEVEGSPVKAKQAAGYEDAKVTIELILEDGPNGSRKDKLIKIQNLFKKAGQEKPIVHEIVNEHTAARRIKKVVFRNLSSKEENKKEQLIVNLEFLSYGTMTITAKKSNTESSTNTAATTLDPAYQVYLKNRGKSPTEESSPAVDTDALAEIYLRRLKGMPY